MIDAKEGIVLLTLFAGIGIMGYASIKANQKSNNFNLSPLNLPKISPLSNLSMPNFSSLQYNSISPLSFNPSNYSQYLINNVNSFAGCNQ